MGGFYSDAPLHISLSLPLWLVFISLNAHQREFFRRAYLSALSRKSVFEAKDETRKQAAALEKAREAAVEEAVSRVRRQVEESMSETFRYFYL